MAKLVETTLWEDAQAPEGGVIKNVKILGQKSRNKRFYTEQALKEAAALYEGKEVYISHAGEKVKHRPAHERYGRLKGVRFDEQKKELRGDLEYLESQATMTAMLKEDIARRLNYFGLSHDADGQFHLKESVKVVTKIDKVNSVDVVSNPATAISLLEQEDAPGATPAADAGPNPQLEALRAGLNAILDKGGDVAAVVTAITEFLDTMKDTGKGKEKPAEGAQEQVSAASIGKLVEQAVSEALKKAAPKKYITPAPAKSTPLTEQTETDKGVGSGDAPPKDKAALKKWLRK